MSCQTTHNIQWNKKDITQFTQCFFYCLSFRWYLWVLLTQPPPRKEKYIKRSDLWNRFLSFFILMFLMSPQRWNILSNSWLIKLNPVEAETTGSNESDNFLSVAKTDLSFERTTITCSTRLCLTVVSLSLFSFSFP